MAIKDIGCSQAINMSSSPTGFFFSYLEAMDDPAQICGDLRYSRVCGKTLNDNAVTIQVEAAFVFQPKHGEKSLKVKKRIEK